MKLLNSAFAGTLLASSAAALRTHRRADVNGPFTGDNVDAQQIQEDDRTTHRLTQVPAGETHKYDALIDYTDEEFPRQTPHDRFVEYLFGTGATEETTSSYEQNLGRHRLRGQQNLVSNPEPSVWLSQVYMGNTTPVDMLMDPSTRESFVWQDEYNMASAFNSEQATLKEENVWRSYFDIDFYGDIVSDKVCLVLNGCTTMDFMYVSSKKGDDLAGDAGGVLGLARPNTSVFVDPSADVPDDEGSLLKEISTDGTAFSTRLSNNVISWIDFGAPNFDETTTDGVTMQLNDDYFWSTQMNSIQIGTSEKSHYGFGNEAKQGEFIDDGIYTILDFNSPDILISKLWYSDFTSKLAKVAGEKASYKSGVMTASCKSDWPDLYFALEGGYQVKVNADDYVQDVSSSGDRSKCQIRIKSLNGPFNILGAPAFLEYYVTHDWEQGTISWYPHSASTKTDLTPIPAPTKFFTTPLETENLEKGELWTFVVAIVITLALLAGFGLVCYYVFHLQMNLELWIVILIGVGGAGVIIGLYFLWYWLFSMVFLPGNTYITVKDSEDALNVKSGHMGLLALLSYFIYKVCGACSGNDEAKKEKKVESLSEIDIDELVNSIE